MSFQAVVSNHTKFVAEKFVLPAPDGQEAVVLLVNATFRIMSGNIAVSEAQRQIVLVDEFWGDPVTSSLANDSQLVLEKPFVDVLIQGHVYAPNGRPSTETLAGIRVGATQKTLTTTGDRFWRRGIVGLVPSSPRPFERLPIRYERAFGGRIDDDIYRSNPVGVGYKQARSADPAVTTEVPNFEYPNSRVTSGSDRVKPAGFGPIGKWWEPRLAHAGTFDAAWLAARWPVLPTDFDSRFNQAAPSDQQIRSVTGGDPVSLLNLSEAGTVSFRIPSYWFVGRFVYDRHRFDRSLSLDTIRIEPDADEFTLTWRASVVTRRTLGVLHKIIVFNDTSRVS